MFGESVGEGELSTLIAATSSCGFGRGQLPDAVVGVARSRLLCFMTELVLGLEFATATGSAYREDESQLPSEDGGYLSPFSRRFPNTRLNSISSKYNNRRYQDRGEEYLQQTKCGLRCRDYRIQLTSWRGGALAAAR